LKLGGSLLDWDRWPQALGDWLKRQAPAANVLIVGGGALADVVRGWDRIYGLDASAAHWLSAGTMSVTAQLAKRLLPNVPSTARFESLVEGLDSRHNVEESDGLLVFDPAEFLARVEPTVPGRVLPHGWHVTSDSIAARLAVVLRAAELVLLKSALPDLVAAPDKRQLQVATLEQAAAIGFVDAFLPELAAELPRIRCVNLRSDEWAEWPARSA
jgi:aspartokinase-like uncharacterized kinase